MLNEWLNLNQQTSMNRDSNIDLLSLSSQQREVLFPFTFGRSIITQEYWDDINKAIDKATLKRFYELWKVFREDKSVNVNIYLDIYDENPYQTYFISNKGQDIILKYIKIPIGILKDQIKLESANRNYIRDLSQIEQYPLVIMNDKEVEIKSPKVVFIDRAFIDGKYYTPKGFKILGKYYTDKEAVIILLIDKVYVITNKEAIKTDISDMVSLASILKQIEKGKNYENLKIMQSKAFEKD